MKISIGSKIFKGPYGGGNAFVKNLHNSLHEDGHEVIDHLNDKDINIIILTNPLKQSSTATFNHFDVAYYQKYINPNSISIHRINECDERKNTNFVNKQIINSNKYIDSTIFVSSWLKELYENIGLKTQYHRVILGGPSKKIFNYTKIDSWNGKDQLKLVTHHWSSDINKGFDIYKKINDLLTDRYWSENFKFTLIGNYPKHYKFTNTNLIGPLDEYDLAKELRSNHLYITASKNEPSGNHHMEAALSGLPILYVDSGALPEYCSEFGFEFSENDLEEKLISAKENYFDLKLRLKSYKYDFSYTYNELFEFIEKLEIEKRNIVINRKSKINLFFIIKYLLNFYFRKLFTLYIKFKKLLGLFRKTLNI